MTKTIPENAVRFRIGAPWRQVHPARKSETYGVGAMLSPRSADGWKLLIYGLIAGLTWMVFSQTLQHEFVNYDDQNYVYKNGEVSAGLTGHGLFAAFTQPHAQNWHPLTTLSHMIDCQIFGLDPSGHHLVNVLLHTAAALLLFSVLNAMTGAMWRSAFVAGLFAIHPLRAESVAWVAERKDVLSGVFFMLTLLAYVRYVGKPSRQRYVVTLMFFALGLMAKPTVVTLPVLLLLLDYWPLRRFGNDYDRTRPNESDTIARFQRCSGARLLAEKIPFLVLSMASAVVTIVVQRHTVGYSQDLPLGWRISNALVSCMTYLDQLVLPVKLAVFYPHPADGMATWQVAVVAFFMIAITTFAVIMRNKRPYLIVGWLWYLVCLIPVIGIIQVGLQGHADRYTYFPSIGIGIALTWAVTDLWPVSSVIRNRCFAIAASIILAALTWKSWVQTSYWKDSESLWTHAAHVTEHNDVAQNNVAALLMERGRIDEAIAHYQLALEAGARSETHHHLSPAIIENSLGNAFAKKGDLGTATFHYHKALQLRPDFADARSNLAAMLLRQGRIDEAISEYGKVVAIPPEDAVSHKRLAEMLVRANRTREAVAEYRRILELEPNSLEVLNALAWFLASSPDPSIRNGNEALVLAERANQLSGGKDPFVLRSLAGAYAACRRWTDALTTVQRAQDLGQNNPTLMRALEEEMASYRAGASRLGGFVATSPPGR